LSRRTKRGRIGTILFFLPVLLLVVLVAYQIVATNTLQTGTLIVEAQSSSSYYTAMALNVHVTIGGQAGSTPLTLTLTQGVYTVTFSEQKWYATPPAKSVTISAGKSTYAIGVYDPIVEFVSVSQDQFNTTQLSAKHGVTPVAWVNHSSGYETIDSQVTGRVIIPPLQNFTYVFQAAGTFLFSMPLVSTPSLVVNVS